MDRRIKISVCGILDTVNDVVRNSLYTINLFEIINSDDFSQSDIIYWPYGKGPSIIKYFLFWIKKDPLFIIHWIGSDVLEEMEKNKKQGIMRIFFILQDCLFRWKMKRGGLINLAVAPWLVDELFKVNITATYLPITNIHKLGTVDINPIKDIDFLSYVPFRSFDFYGGDKILKLADRWQKYKFLIICGDLNEIPPDFIEKIPKNVTFSPRVDWSKMPEFYQRSKFFIRYTQHDGEALSVHEALYYNLQVLWTYDFPCTIKIETQEKLSDSIPSLVNNWHPNYGSHEFIIENYSIEKWRVKFLEILQSK